MDVEERVLERIVPSEEYVAELEDKSRRLIAEVTGYAAEHGIDVEVTLAGSFSKGTFLSDPDFDVFMMFPSTVPHDELERIGLKIGEDILHGTRMFSDHPYTRGNFEGIDVDLVPCYRLDSTDKLKSAVDRTPFHTKYILSHLDSKQKNEVRLLKRFMKGIGTYGAEQDARGFSGYLCEVLVVYYKSFRGVLEGSQRWKSNYTIAIEGKGPSMVAPLVVYDPVDSRRNVASAVHEDTMGTFITAAKAYLADPSERFFFPEKRDALPREDLAAIAEKHGSRLVTAIFDKPEGILEDSLYSQLWKTQYALGKKLNEFSFNVLRAVHDIQGDKLVVMYEIERDMLSKTHKHYGPPVWVSNSNTFLERWKNNEYGSPFIENGTWTVIAERMYFTAKEMLYDEAAMSGLGRDLDPNTMQVLSHVQTLAAADPLMMTELLDPKLPWEV
ncbi:MAG: CCA tRNA nucleotidyltransferase [Candidatus Methanomethylophilaceae archaeon]|nr:CCA tRNA nucleotidyltransferase [Candidatus Methanomethylophilaceae archaeon]